MPGVSLGDTPQVAALYANVSIEHKRNILEKACRAGVAFLCRWNRCNGLVSVSRAVAKTPYNIML
jgi:hypothetical protein